MVNLLASGLGAFVFIIAAGVMLGYVGITVPRTLIQWLMKTIPEKRALPELASALIIFLLAILFVYAASTIPFLALGQILKDLGR